MLKRTVLLLGLTAGILGGLPFGNASSLQTMTFTLDNGKMHASDVRAVLKLASPQLGIPYGEAMSAYAHKVLTIDPVVGIANTYDVRFGGMCLMILLEDAL